jgi:hypothetical protein
MTVATMDTTAWAHKAIAYIEWLTPNERAAGREIAARNLTALADLIAKTLRNHGTCGMPGGLCDAYPCESLTNVTEYASAVLRFRR